MSGVAGGFQIKSRETDGKLINGPDSPNNCKIFVGGISKNTNTDNLRAYFEKYGEVRDVDIKIDPNTQASRGFGFVLFADSSSIDALEQEGGTHNLDGKKIDPKRAEKRNAKIFVGGLKSDFSDEEVQAVFAEHGEIELYERRMDKTNGRKQPFCFITFKDDQVATKLCKQHWFELMGKRCEIKTAVENKDKKIAAGTWGRGQWGNNPGGNHGGGYGGHGGGSYGGGHGGGYNGGGGFGGGAWGAGSGPGGNSYGGGGGYNNDQGYGQGYGSGGGGYQGGGAGDYNNQGGGYNQGPPQPSYDGGFGGNNSYGGNNYGGGSYGGGGNSYGGGGNSYGGRGGGGGRGGPGRPGRGGRGGPGRPGGRGGPMRGRGGGRPAPY